MKIQFKNNTEKDNAVSIFEKLLSHWLYGSINYIELGFTDLANEAENKYKFAESVKKGIQNDGNFTGLECAKCIEMLTYLPKGFCRNEIEEVIIDNIIKIFKIALNEEIEKKNKEKNKEILEISLTRGEIKALDDILGVLYDYILYDGIYDILNNYELKIRDKINEIVVKYDLQKENKLVYENDKIYRERVGKYFIRSICDTFTYEACSR